MVYLLDEQYTEASHSRMMKSIIRHHTETEIELVEVHSKISIAEVMRILNLLADIVKPRDIVFCPWAIDANVRVDYLFEELSERCFVVTAAGNTGESVDKYSPARVHGVYTVGSLNKKGEQASHSNYSNDKKIIWVPGTNYPVNDKLESGTSVAAALYTAFLAEAINKQDIAHVDTMILGLKSKNLVEISV